MFFKDTAHNALNFTDVTKTSSDVHQLCQAYVQCHPVCI